MDEIKLRDWRFQHLCFIIILFWCLLLLFHVVFFHSRHLDPHSEEVCLLSLGSFNYFQDIEERINGGEARRLLSRPGSWPPRCFSKCGRCTPCRPVHVAVPPGNPVTAEYYPEAWRCKCGNKLYVP